MEDQFRRDATEENDASDGDNGRKLPVGNTFRRGAGTVWQFTFLAQLCHSLARAVLVPRTYKYGAPAFCITLHYDE